ncbi:MAG TPA: hypothetical protein VMC42_09655 [Methanoregulaceae archaeon]|nr:hypothetical protein [Methanoregulaceae archaeon]
MAAIKWCIALALLIVLTVSSVSGAISVHNIVITPSGTLIAGQTPPQRVTGSLLVDFVPEGGLTFDSQNDLNFHTDLDNVTWDYTLILDGNPNVPQYVNGKTLDIGGWLLSYPSRRNLGLSANFSGDVPQVTASGQKTILAVKVVNGAFDVNPALDVTRVANVVLPGSPLNQTGTGQPAAIPTTAGTTVAATAPSAPPGQAPESLAVPLDILTAIVLLLAIIPLAILVSHDHFAQSATRFPQAPGLRAGIAVVQILCGFGILFGLLILQSSYVTLALKGTDLNSVILLVVLFLMSYFAISAFIVAAGSLISKAFRWTMKSHVIIGIVVLLTGPAALFLSGAPNAAGPAAAVIVAGVVSVVLALWQERSVRTDLTEDWISRLSGAFHRMKQESSTHHGTGKNGDSALAVLNLRLAKGEISLEEYNRMKEAIKK